LLHEGYLLHGLFWPKLQTGSGPVRVFGTLKGGFINFRFNPNPAIGPGFFSSVRGLRDETSKEYFTRVAAPKHFSAR